MLPSLFTLILGIACAFLGLWLIITPSLVGVNFLLRQGLALMLMSLTIYFTFSFANENFKSESDDDAQQRRRSELRERFNKRR